MTGTGAAARAHQHLLRLYEISKRLTRFQTGTGTVPEVLALVSGSVPLRSAVLMLDQGAPPMNRTRLVAWRAVDVTPPQLLLAKARAKTGYAYFVRAAVGVDEEAGAYLLPSTPPRSGTTGVFVLLPLVVQHDRVFGALQIESDAPLDEADLTFLNAMVNQLAIALDRVTVIESNEAIVAVEIARRAAIAVENASLYETAQREVQARQDLLSTVSHDLRNPLSTIVMSAQLLQASPPGADRTKPLEMILRSAHRMNRIIADLLDIASIESGRMTVDLRRHAVAPLVREAVEIHRLFAETKAIRLEGAVTTEGMAVECDPGRVLQVLGNLIGNAIKFTPEGGVVTVRAERRDTEALFSVEDSGPGVPADEVPDIFDRFWQAKKTARLGTGLGLSIAKGLVEAHRGRIWVESTPGKGATFFVAIPLLPAGAIVAASSTAGSAAPS